MMTDSEAIDLLGDLCGIYSPSGDESAAAQLMVDRASATGMHAFVDDAGNFVATHGHGRPTILLLGHVDTVAGFIPPRVDNGRLYGRGSVDAKGPLAAFLAATARVPAASQSTITIVGAVEEEAPSSKGAHYIVDRYQPAVAIVGEPSGTGGITLGYKGRVTVRLQASHTHAHTAAPGRSLAARAAEFWTRLEEHCDHFNDGRRGFDRIDPHLSEFHTAGDGFLDLVDLRGSLRLPLTYPVADLQERLQAMAPEWGTVALEHLVLPFTGDRRNRLVRALLRAIRHEGLNPTFKLKTGTSDMNVVGPRWHCPIVAYGPGDSRLDHTPDEHVVLEEYLRAIAILTRALGELAA